jgi:predicted HicB family RNase H-like nuclease
MKNVLKHKDFIGSVQFSSTDEIFYGKITGIEDLVNFEGESVIELKSAFIEAVEEYIELCKSLGKDPFKSYKGTLNVRIGPELHKQATEHATIQGITLNKYIQNAIAREVNEEKAEYGEDLTQRRKKH